MHDVEINPLRAWVGRQQTREQRIEPFAADALAGLLDLPRRPQAGDALPLPWHWLYFLDAPSRADTGIDGHPRRGDFLPPVPLPRRMWAGGRFHIERQLVIGAPAHKISTVRSVELKQGKTGPLVFVQVEHALHQDGQLCLQEQQDLVYREAPTAAGTLAPGGPAPALPMWSARVQPDPVLLFRYSALTCNGHRIHYDRGYAVQQEFYPALVVQGPLLATLLLDLLQRELPAARLRRFQFRALAPAFDTDPIQLCGRVDGQQVRLWTLGPQGGVGMSASAEIA